MENLQRNYQVPRNVSFELQSPSGDTLHVEANGNGNVILNATGANPNGWKINQKDQQQANAAKSGV